MGLGRQLVLESSGEGEIYFMKYLVILVPI